MNAQDLEEAIDPGTRAAVERLEAQVQGRLSGRVAAFRLLLRGRGLVLQGRSRTYYAKQLAQHAVLEAKGLPIVANEIVVS
jgi:hypothetical protein